MGEYVLYRDSRALYVFPSVEDLSNLTECSVTNFPLGGYDYINQIIKAINPSPGPVRSAPNDVTSGIRNSRPPPHQGQRLAALFS